MRGRASSVIDQGDGTVLRTGGDPEREAALMALAAAGGIRVPRVHEVRPDALVLERIDGRTMSAEVLRRPWTVGAQVGTLADLHQRLHRIPLDGRRLLHLDLHPENVMIASDGPVVIDWTNARAGDPAMDVALTWLILATSGGWPGRVVAGMFRRRVGEEAVRAGLPAARDFRLADRNVTDAERRAVRRAVDGEIG
jgi:aminoglycoside phosphotransferase (APT) family kinase protein